MAIIDVAQDDRLRDGLGQVPTPFLGAGRRRPALEDNW